MQDCIQDDHKNHKQHFYSTTYVLHLSKLPDRKEIENENYGDKSEDQNTRCHVGVERQGGRRIPCLVQEITLIVKLENMGYGDKLCRDENNPTEPKSSKTYWSGIRLYLASLPCHPCSCVSYRLVEKSFWQFKYWSFDWKKCSHFSKTSSTGPYYCA